MQSYSGTCSEQTNKNQDGNWPFQVWKNDTDVAHYNLNAHQPIAVIFGIALACYIFHTHQPFLTIFFVDNKVVLLSTVRKYYFSPSHFVFETQQTALLKGVHVPQVVQRQLVRRGGMTNHRLIAYSLSNISAKNNCLTISDTSLSRQLTALVLTTKHPKIRKQNTTHNIHPEHKRQTAKTALAYKTNCAPVWYTFDDCRPENKLGPRPKNMERT